jgi:hypothetical protein
MITSKSLLYKAALLTVAGNLAGQCAFAQGFINKKQDLPDASRFYMSRMQVQYVDDGPVVTHQTNPGGQQGGGGIPGVPPQGLPRAGFQSYTPEMPQLQTSLPKVNNGVPTKLPPPKPKAPGAATGLKAHTGKLPAGKPTTKPAQPAMEAYTPYKGYNPANFGGSASSAASSQSNVKGSVLHWARARHDTNGY